MKNIVVPIDFSSVTQSVVDLAGQLAKSLGAEIHLIHVKELIPVIPPGGPGFGMAGMAELMPTSTLPMGQPIPETLLPDEAEKAKLVEWQKKLEAEGLRVTSHSVVGDIVNEIFRVASDSHGDLIVMGRHGHGAMYNLLVGSVTEGVLKVSRWPVLLIPETQS